MSMTFCLPRGITLSAAWALWLESNSLLGGGVELVVDAFVLVKKVALWYFVVSFGCSGVPNSSLLFFEN